MTALKMVGACLLLLCVLVLGFLWHGAHIRVVNAPAEIQRDFRADHAQQLARLEAVRQKNRDLEKQAEKRYWNYPR